MSDLAWAAGLFEGEGCFTVSHKTKPSGKVYAQIVATMTMADQDVMERFARIIGFGKVRYLGAPRPGTKPVWRWAVQSREAVEKFYLLIEPWLGERRKQRAQEVLATPRGALCPTST